MNWKLRLWNFFHILIPTSIWSRVQHFFWGEKFSNVAKSLLWKLFSLQSRTLDECCTRSGICGLDFHFTLQIEIYFHWFKAFSRDNRTSAHNMFPNWTNSSQNQTATEVRMVKWKLLWARLEEFSSRSRFSPEHSGESLGLSEKVFHAIYEEISFSPTQVEAPEIRNFLSFTF